MTEEQNQGKKKYKFYKRRVLTRTQLSSQKLNNFKSSQSQLSQYINANLITKNSQIIDKSQNKSHNKQKLHKLLTVLNNKKNQIKLKQNNIKAAHNYQVKNSSSHRLFSYVKDKKINQTFLQSKEGKSSKRYFRNKTECDQTTQFKNKTEFDQNTQLKNKAECDQIIKTLTKIDYYKIIQTEQHGLQNEAKKMVGLRNYNSKKTLNEISFIDCSQIFQNTQLSKIDNKKRQKLKISSEINFKIKPNFSSIHKSQSCAQDLHYLLSKTQIEGGYGQIKKNLKDKQRTFKIQTNIINRQKQILPNKKDTIDIQQIKLQNITDQIQINDCIFLQKQKQERSSSYIDKKVTSQFDNKVTSQIDNQVTSQIDNQVTLHLENKVTSQIDNKMKKKTKKTKIKNQKRRTFKDMNMTNIQQIKQDNDTTFINSKIKLNSFPEQNLKLKQVQDKNQLIQQFRSMQNQIDQISCTGEIASCCSQIIGRQHKLWYVPSVLLYKYCYLFIKSKKQMYTKAYNFKIINKSDFQNYNQQMNILQTNLQKIIKRCKKHQLLDSKTQTLLQINSFQNIAKNKAIQYIQKVIKQLHIFLQNIEIIQVEGKYKLSLKIIFALLTILKFHKYQLKQIQNLFKTDKLQSMSEDKCKEKVNSYFNLIFNIL